MNKSRIYHIIEWIVAVIACGYLVYALVTYDDYPGLWSALRTMSSGQWTALVLAMMLMPVNMAIEAWKWRTLMGNGMSFGEAQRQVYYSKLAGLITPWRLGEYPARGVLIHQKGSDASTWSQVLAMGAVGSATMTSAIVGAGLLALGFSGLFGDKGDIASLSYMLLVGAVLAVLAVLLGLAPQLLRRWAVVSQGLILRTTMQSLIRLLCWCIQLAMVLYALDSFHLSTFNFHLLPLYYLLVTITPNVPIAEAAVRGVWALTLFGSVNAALAGVLLWGINTLLPCLIWPFLRKNAK